MHRRSMDVDVVVIGSGVVGAAVAQTLAARGDAVWVLEAKARAGGETSERNSGVVHASLYYPANSLKTRLCVAGNRLLHHWAARHGVPLRRTGKLVVARNDAEEAALERLFAHGKSVGAGPLELLGAEALAARDPDVIGRAAVWSPWTSVTDPVAFTHSLLDDARAHGAELLVGARVEALEPIPGGWRVRSTRGEVEARAVVNAAGLAADHIARLAGVDRYTLHPCRGDYFWIKRRRAHPHLVYPMKAPGSPGLGIHLTIDVDGRARLGPDVTWVDARDDYAPAEHKRDAFLAAARTLLRDVGDDDLAYDACGIRPKLRAPHEAEERDFVIALDAPSLVNLVGIESPGLTASLAVALEVAQHLPR
jgi:L-2-hydroxyglutarate oxidase LhgO